MSADILAISKRGEMAVSLGRQFIEGSSTAGTLARAPLQGGGAREVLAGVQEADWSPDSDQLMVVRTTGGRYRIEWPLGKVLYESGGWISHARISPDGHLVAFLEHPGPDDDRGAVLLVDRQGRVRVLADGWTSAQGLAWAPAGDEIWFTATRLGGNNALHAVRLDGQIRLVARSAGRLVLHDVARGGRALVTQGAPRERMMIDRDTGASAQDLSTSDASWAVDLSADGRTLLYAQAGESEGASYASYLRSSDGGPSVRLGDGLPLVLSPDGRWVLALVYAAQPYLVLLPTGAGEPVRLPSPSPADSALVEWARWLPDGREIIYASHGSTDVSTTQLWIVPVTGGLPRRLEGVSPAAFAGGAVTPDGSYLVTIDKAGQLVQVPLAGGRASGIAGAFADRTVMRLAADGRSVLVRRRGAHIRISRVELGEGSARGKERLLWELPTEGRQHLPGFEGIASVAVTPDGRVRVYSYFEAFSILYLVDFPDSRAGLSEPDTARSP